MNNYDYQTAVAEDIVDFITNNIDLEEYEDRDDAFEELNDILWIEDSVTGNGSGSYTFNREKAKEYVLEDMETVRQALREFCVSAEEIGNKFLDEDWEYLDVTARCFVLGAAIDEALDMMDSAGELPESWN